MIARRVAMLTEMTCAAPAYIDRFGMPSTIEALDGHRMVGFRSSATGALLPLELFSTGSCATSISRPRWRSTGRKSRRRRQARSGADPGAALTTSKRFAAGNAGFRPPRLSADADAGFAALSPQSAAFTARPRVHRLARRVFARGQG